MELPNINPNLPPNQSSGKKMTLIIIIILVIAALALLLSRMGEDGGGFMDGLSSGKRESVLKQLNLSARAVPDSEKSRTIRTLSAGGGQNTSPPVAESKQIEILKSLEN